MRRARSQPPTYGRHPTITALLVDARIQELHRAAADARLAAELRSSKVTAPPRPLAWRPVVWQGQPNR